MQEGQINSSKHWRFGVKNALKTFKESVNAGFVFRYILYVSWVSWFGQLRQFLVVCPTGSFVFFLLPHSHWEPLPGASKCHYLRGSGQGMQQRQAPDLFTRWELQDVLQRFGFQVVPLFERQHDERKWLETTQVLSQMRVFHGACWVGSTLRQDLRFVFFCIT